MGDQLTDVSNGAGSPGAARRASRCQPDKPRQLARLGAQADHGQASNGHLENATVGVVAIGTQGGAAMHSLHLCRRAILRRLSDDRKT